MQELKTGDIAMLMRFCPRFKAGEVFDLVKECRRGHSWFLGISQRHYEWAAPLAAGLCEEHGFMEDHGGGMWSITEAGERAWKDQLAYDWRKHRQGAGRRTKGDAD